MLKNYKIMCRAGNFIAKTGDFFLIVFTLTTGSSIFFRTEFRSHWYNSGGPLLTLSFTNVAKVNIPQNFFLEKMNSKRYHMKVLSQRVFISII